MIILYLLNQPIVMLGISVVIVLWTAIWRDAKLGKEINNALEIPAVIGTILGGIFSMILIINAFSSGLYRIATVQLVDTAFSVAFLAIGLFICAGFVINVSIIKHKERKLAFHRIKHRISILQNKQFHIYRLLIMVNEEVPAIRVRSEYLRHKNTEIGEEIEGIPLLSSVYAMERKICDVESKLNDLSVEVNKFVEVNTK